MTRALLPLLLCFPLLLSAQLDKIRPGMTIEEFRSNFPNAEHDYGAMTSYVYSNETKGGAKGVATYIISHDTVETYWFQSQRVDGPCAEHPAGDSSDCLRLLTAARTLIGHYTDLYGDPKETYSHRLLESGGDAFEVNVLFAKWKTASNEIEVAVHRPGKAAEISAANSYEPLDKKAGPPACSYVLEVVARGKGRDIRSEFGNGYAIGEFSNWRSDLAPQLKTFPDAWTLKDTETVPNGMWHFAFTDGKLSSFSLELYAGVNYGQPTMEAYGTLWMRASKMTMEGNKAYGFADSTSKEFPAEYSAPKKNKNYYSIVDYYVRWKVDGQTIVMEMDEDGGGKQGEPVFRLEVVCEGKQ